MRKKLAVLVTMLAMLLLTAAPAFADTAFAQVGGATAFGNSQFFGGDTAAAQAGGATAVAQSTFFGGTFFGGGIFR